LILNYFNYFHFYHLQSKDRTVNQYFYNTFTSKDQKKWVDYKDGFEAGLFKVAVKKNPNNHSLLTEPSMVATPKPEHITQAFFLFFFLFLQ